MTVAGMEGVEPSSRLADGSVLREVPRKMNPAERQVRCTDRNRFGLARCLCGRHVCLFPIVTFARPTLVVGVSVHVLPLLSRLCVAFWRHSDGRGVWCRRRVS